MKKNIFDRIIISAGSIASALSQGYVVFENAFGAGSVYAGSFFGPYAALGTYHTVALCFGRWARLWSGKKAH